MKLRKLYKSILQTSSERVRNENPCWKKKRLQTSSLQRLSFSVIDTLAYLQWAKCTTQQLQGNFHQKWAKCITQPLQGNFYQNMQLLGTGMKPECPQKVMWASGYKSTNDIPTASSMWHLRDDLLAFGDHFVTLKL